MRAVQRSYDDRRGTTVERGYDEHHERLRVVCFQRDEWLCRECGWEPDVVRDCRLADVEVAPADVVLDELRRAKLAGERHLHADHVLPSDESRGRQKLAAESGEDGSVAETLQSIAPQDERSQERGGQCLPAQFRGAQVLGVAGVREQGTASTFETHAQRRTKKQSGSCDPDCQS